MVFDEISKFHFDAFCQRAWCNKILTTATGTYYRFIEGKVSMVSLRKYDSQTK